jgi:hypothetical protein
MSDGKENSFVIFFERILFHTVFFPLGKIKYNSQILTLLMLQFQALTILRIPYVRHSAQQIFIASLAPC